MTRALALTLLLAMPVLGAGCSDDEDPAPILATGSIVDAGDAVKVDILLLPNWVAPSEIGETVEIPELGRVRTDDTGHFTLRLEPDDVVLSELTANGGLANFQISAFNEGRQWHCAFTRNAHMADGRFVSWEGEPPDLVAQGAGCVDASAEPDVTALTSPPAG